MSDKLSLLCRLREKMLHQQLVGYFCRLKSATLVLQDFVVVLNLLLQQLQLVQLLLLQLLRLQLLLPQLLLLQLLLLLVLLRQVLLLVKRVSWDAANVAGQKADASSAEIRATSRRSLDQV
jgi:hypothetical protein